MEIRESIKYSNFHHLLKSSVIHVSGNAFLPSALEKAQANRKLISCDRQHQA